MSNEFKVEQEIVQPTASMAGTGQPVASASGTALFDLVVQWVTAQVQAYLDPRAMNPRFSDFVEAIDHIVFGYLMQDVVQASDTVQFNVVAQLADAVHAMDPLAVAWLFPVQDSAKLSDTITVATEALLQDALSASDLIVFSSIIALADPTLVQDIIAAHHEMVAGDTVVASDSGTIAQNDYFGPGYIDDSYIGTISTF